MKIVVCTNCGAKYQLEDFDDVSTFECSVCTGNLEELKDNNINNQDDVKDNGLEVERYEKSDSVIVCCQNCGLKFKLDKHENIRDFECVSCEGPLKYLDDELNKMYEVTIIPKVIDNSTHEVEIIDDNVSLQDTLLAASFENNSSNDSDDCIIVEHNLDENVSKENVEVEDSQTNIVNETVDKNVESPQINQTKDIKSSFEESLSVDGVSEVIVPEVSEESLSVDVSDVVVPKVVEESLPNEIPENKLNELSDEVISDNISNDSVSPNSALNDDISEDSESLNIGLDAENSSSEDESDKEVIVKNGLVFNDIDEYNHYEETLSKTYDALKNSIKNEYLVELDNAILTKEYAPLKEEDVLKLVDVDKSEVKSETKSAGETKLKDNINDKDLMDNAGVNNTPIDSMGYNEDTPLNKMSYKNLVDSRRNPAEQFMEWLPFIFGILFILGGIIVYVLLSLILPTGILVLIGILILIYAVYKRVDDKNKEIRSKIIRESLEQLPKDFYLFYYTKPPYAKDALNHVVVGPTGIFTILTQKYSAKQDKHKQKSDAENDALLGGASDIGNYMSNRNRLELTDGYDDHQTRFQFGNEEIQFDYNNKIKHKSLTLNEDLAIFLDKNGINGVYIEPLIGFVNEDVAVINVVLTNEDLFLEELLYKIANGPKRLDTFEIRRISRLLSKYSINCNI